MYPMLLEIQNRIAFKTQIPVLKRIRKEPVQRIKRPLKPPLAAVPLQAAFFSSSL
jgi:hypothetical protein